jgi:hypothetical protein
MIEWLQGGFVPDGSREFTHYSEMYCFDTTNRTWNLLPYVLSSLMVFFSLAAAREGKRHRSREASLPRCTKRRSITLVGW